MDKNPKQLNKTTKRVKKEEGYCEFAKILVQTEPSQRSRNYRKGRKILLVPEDA